MTNLRPGSQKNIDRVAGGGRRADHLHMHIARVRSSSLKVS